MFIINKRVIRNFDWITFCIIITLSLLGLLFIFSSTYTVHQTYSLFFKKQLFGILGAIVLFLVCSLIDHRQLLKLGYFFYFLILLLLVFTMVKGSIGMGAKRWIHLIFIKVQPSELAKLFFPFFAVYFLKTQKDRFCFSFTDFIPILLILALSFFLILKQPDLGTALLLLSSGLLLLWLAGLSKAFFIALFTVTISLTPIYWKILKPYQKKRVEVFLGYGTKKKERYQIEQSHISIGSGGLFGKGVLQGTQTRLLFLPESRTDFIFSVLCEEIGFFGAFFVILLYFILFLRMFMTISRISSPFMQLFALGLILHIILSTLVNMCMVTGLLPIVGIPLPFMSYGLSNLWITFIALGCFNSIRIQKR